MSLIDTTGLHHVRITVTDAARSRAFYEEVLGFTVAAESPGDPDDPAVRADPGQLYGGVIFDANGFLLGLRPVGDRGDRFDSTRVGLDHISFAVADTAALFAIKDRLADAGVEHGEILQLDGFGIAILSLQDPDGINLELSAPLN
jgi:glyoxylase I family protein